MKRTALAWFCVLLTAVGLVLVLDGCRTTATVPIDAGGYQGGDPAVIGGAPAWGGAGGGAGQGGTAIGGNADVACRAFIRTAPGVRKLSKSTKPRIVGGKPVNIGVWPATVAIEQPGGFQYCGGTLIRPNWVVTAGHCEVAPGDRAVLGRADLRLSDGESITVQETRTHYLYFDPERGYDVALARLERPAAAPPADLVPAGWSEEVLAEVLGWGLTSEYSQGTSPILLGTEVPIRDGATCQRAYPGLPSTALCAGYDAGGRDTCQGDSGGGLLVQLGGDGGIWWALAGITSFGDGCARPGKPGVYTAIAQVRDWIDACARD